MSTPALTREEIVFVEYLAAQLYLTSLGPENNAWDRWPSASADTRAEWRSKAAAFLALSREFLDIRIKDAPKREAQLRAVIESLTTIRKYSLADEVPAFVLPPPS